MSFNDRKRLLSFTFPVSTSMRCPPATVSPEKSIHSVLVKLMKENIGCVIVVKEGRGVGIITEKDVLEKCCLLDKNINKMLAKDVMSTPLISIEEDQSIKEGLELMQKYNIRRLAVTKKGSLTGVTTQRRLLVTVGRWEV